MAGYREKNRNGINLGFFNKQLKKISNFGLTYDEDSIPQSYAIGVNDDPSKSTNMGNTASGPYMYDLFSKRMIAKILDKKSVAYLDRAYLDKRKVLQQYSIKDEIRGYITEIADETIIYDENNYFCRSLDLPSDFDDVIRQRVHENFKKIYTSFGFDDGTKAWNSLKDLLINGYIAFEIIYDRKQKNIVDIVKLDPVTLVPASDPESGTLVWVQYPDDPKLRRLLLDAQIIYISYSNNQDYTETSYVEPLIRPYNQLKLLEQTKILYNINQAAIYKKFVIPIGGLSRNAAEQQIAQLMSEYHEDIQWEDDLGIVKINGSSNIPHSKDYWFPSSGENGTPEMSIETPTGNDLNEDQMLIWFHNNLKRESKIPFSRFEQDTGGGSLFGDSTDYTRDELKFHNYIRRIRTVFKEIMVKPLKIQMLRDFPELMQDHNFISHLNIEFNANELFEEWTRLNNLAKRSEIAANLLNNIQNADDTPYLSSEWVIRKIMKFTDADIQENMKYKMKESGQLEGGQESGGQKSGGQEDFGEPSGPGADFFNKSESQPSEMGGEAQVGGEISGEAPTEPTPQTQAPAQETPTQTQ